MVDDANNKGVDGGGKRQERAAGVTERLQAAKAQILSAAPESPPDQSLSLKPLLAGVGVIALVAVLWMVFGGGQAPVEVQPVPKLGASMDVEAEPSAALAEARERLRQARERVRVAEEAARQAHERRLVLEAEQAAERALEAEQARRDAEEHAAALAGAREAAQREALEARQAEARREAAERAAQAERERQAALAAQQAEEEQASQQAEEVRQGLGDQLNWGVDL